jgi:hypothetical protein
MTLKKDVVRVVPRRHMPTDAQLHAKACIDCGSPSGPFSSAGYVYTRSGAARLGWAVVTCVKHVDNAAAELVR